MVFKLSFQIFAIVFIGTFSLQLQSQTDGQGLDFLISSPSEIAGSYSWRGAVDFGSEITSDFCAQLVWAENGAETLACDPLSSDTDLSGKIALIRRGECDFSQKVYNAQLKGAEAVVIVNHNVSGDINELVGMLGGANSELITIPSFFVSYATGMTIIPFLDEGGVVEVCIAFRTFYSEFGPYSYTTPQSQIVPLENLAVTIVNRSLNDKTGVESRLEITDPNGIMTELTSIDDLPRNTEVRIGFDLYLPEAKGVYSMKFISGNDGREITRTFEISDYTWAVDDGVPIGSRGPDVEQFTSANFFFQHANLVLAGSDGIATHVTFGLGNGGDLFVDDPSADIILIALYNADSDEDGQIDNFESFDELGDPLEIGFYEIQGTEVFDNLVTIPLDSPVSLEEGGIYFVSIAYDGLDAGTGIGPKFSASSNVDYPGIQTTPLQLGQLYGGWDGVTTLITRLHLEGFVSSTKDFEFLGEDKLKILSNPVINNKLIFKLSLNDPSERIDIMFRNLEGKLIQHLNYKNIKDISESINVTGLPSGTYFLNVNTEEGFRSEKVIIQN